VLEGLRAWWGETSLVERILIGATATVGLLAIGLIVVVVTQSGEASDTRADLGATERRVDDLGAENEKLTADLSAAQEQLTSAKQEIAQLEESIATQEQALADAADLAETSKSQAAADLAREKRSLAEAKTGLAEAETDKEQAEKLVAELTLAYSEDINAARATLASEASAFACDWGASQAVAGRTANSVSGSAALSAFASSDELAALREAPEIVTAIEVAQTLREDRYGVSADVVETVAADCWQKEDAKINAALYAYQNVFRSAVLDAACTQGASNAYSDYRETSGYQSWWLKVGDDTEIEYRTSVRDRFGSIEAFVAIPVADIDAESARCRDIRDLIEPKHSGTWNVGDEIMPGTWKAYDVSDCYWARLSVNGNIRANQFGDGLRLSVNISSSDGQFEISGCTFYFANP